MTQPVPLPTPQVTPMDPSSPDSASTPPTQSATAASARAKPKTLRLPDNTLTMLLGTIVALFLGLSYTQTNDRISRLEDKVDAGFAAVDAKFDAKFDEVDARFDAQNAKVDAKFDEVDARFDEVNVKFDARFDEIDLKLTALIAALNATAEVEAALDGRLLDPNTSPAGSP